MFRTTTLFPSGESIKPKMNQVTPNGIIHTNVIRSVYTTGKYSICVIIVIALSSVHTMISMPSRKKLFILRLRISLNQNKPRIYATAKQIYSERIKTKSTPVTLNPFLLN